MAEDEDEELRDNFYIIYDVILLRSSFISY